MAQTSGIVPAGSDRTKKTVTAILQPKRTEATPGLLSTRNTLKGIRSSTIPKGHAPRGK